MGRRITELDKWARLHDPVLLGGHPVSSPALQQQRHGLGNGPAAADPGVDGSDADAESERKLALGELEASQEGP